MCIVYVCVLVCGMGVTIYVCVGVWVCMRESGIITNTQFITNSVSSSWTRAGCWKWWSRVAVLATRPFVYFGSGKFPKSTPN